MPAGLVSAVSMPAGSIGEMNWASAQIGVAVSKFLLEQGYGCDVKVVPSDTTPAVTSLAENNEPDIVPELWRNSTGEVYDKLKKGGKVVELTKTLDPGGVEGWWIPTYLAEEHPELKTIDGILADELMQQIAARGGVIGIGFWEGAVCKGSVGAIADAIVYAVNLLGAEHVGLGSDFDGAVTAPIDTAQVAELTQALMDRGLDDETIRFVMGENEIRFFLEHLPEN